MKRAVQMMILIVAAVLLFNLSPASGQMFFMKNENIAKEAKNFTLNTLNSGETSLTEFREGKRAVVFFWATWCPHCRVALADLNQRKDEIEGLGIKIIPVDVGESAEVVGRYFEKNKIYMDVFLDEQSTTAEAYGVIGVPSFYFIGEDGIVRDVQHGIPEDLDGAFYGS